MYIVDHKFNKPNGDITPHREDIVNLLRHKQRQLMENTGFLGVNLDTSADNTCFTISIFWESETTRNTANLNMNSIAPVTELQDYCLANNIVRTKDKREV